MTEHVYVPTLTRGHEVVRKRIKSRVKLQNEHKDRAESRVDARPDPGDRYADR